ncbi:hypothetical protein TR13x_05890 [Caloranaerobacter sp. TR13]|uniref:hypothetical protein n=1 Tax=Caloranaerobacter sp. TR13 TaxID=1302151 RepID=UPI0006D3D1C5|nr:hypothetical protein [Caloranaerobacter sp. TR13]KPU27276.1 hypothetical protein TR13x_05890 [Caloranaerobacter sp. TR13]
MKEIDERDTAILLAVLDKEIDMKCMELKEKQWELKLKKIFFSSCLLVLFTFLIQVFFKIFNLNILFVFFIYQGLALIFVTPLIFNLNKGRLT